MKISAQQMLQEELSRRVAKNPRYSLRSFASALKISPATLSLILSGRMRVSKKTILKMSEIMDLKLEDLDNLVKNSKPKNTEAKDYAPYPSVTMDIFHILSKWHHYAILSLLELSNFNVNPHWIARRLGISVTEAKLAFDRLERLEMIEQAGGKWRQSKNPIRIDDDAKPNVAARLFQKQMIMKALHSLENDDYKTRDVTSITFAMNSKQLERVRERITHFRRNVCEEFEKSKNKDAVYTMAIQFFPLTKNSEEEL